MNLIERIQKGDRRVKLPRTIVHTDIQLIGKEVYFSVHQCRYNKDNSITKTSHMSRVSLADLRKHKRIMGSKLL